MDLGYCGNTIANGGTLLTDTSNPGNYTCEMRCPGAEPEICGGSAVLSIYNNTKYVAPKQKAKIGKYVAKGCLTDPNTSGRSLQGASTTSSVMMEELCVKYCLGQRYHYAGIEYGDECYCGNS